MEEIVIDKLIGKGLIKEKWSDYKNDFTHTLTNDGKKTIIEMIKDPMWRKVAQMIRNGVNDNTINLYIDSCLKCKK